jgi:hypothetical protein
MVIVDADNQLTSPPGKCGAFSGLKHVMAKID